ncbi:transporter substrate-binding domain-containing protein [Cognatishimia maritima]|uniref:Amino acid ABC transporter substrate-binding protein, PAAT family n=1 Tax=Cognatishimia maritima TaxID=870908 RepID=A0A1M5QP97_9RHOB|nr:transporter substrate-binding domain-containing protein [Cognatishimia maritima]SHH15942.1 amino acid ABC transporter substrate-binding protein, PAAT family [Cognatishimia maritima]
MVLAKTKGLIAASAALALSVLGAQHAAADSISDIQNAGSMKVGMLVDFPPVGFMNSDNEPDGYDADISAMLGEKLGVDVEIVPVTGPNRIPYLLSGQVDLLISSLAITPERAEKVDFSEPYAAVRIGIFGPTDLDISDADDLPGHVIGVTRASGQDATLTKIAPEGTNIRRFDDDVSAVQALLSGQVEAIGVSNIGMKQIHQIAPGKFNEKFEMNRFILALGVHPDDDAMMDYVNTFLGEIKASGQLEATYQKWFEESLPDFSGVVTK